MTPEQSTPDPQRGGAAGPTGTVQYVHDESLVLRNYDGASTHELTVTFYDAEGDVAFDRTYTLAPREVLSVATRLQRAVYRVEVTAAGRTDSADCLVGSGPGETALVETGNGIVSVAEGVAVPGGSARD